MDKEELAKLLTETEDDLLATMDSYNELLKRVSPPEMRRRLLDNRKEVYARILKRREERGHE